MPKLQLTPAQNIALHTVQALGLASLLSLGVGIVQFVGLHGLDYTQLITFASGGFLTSMAMIWKTLSSNPNTMQAVMDTLGEIKDQVNQTPPSTTPVPPAMPQFVQPAPLGTFNLTDPQNLTATSTIPMIPTPLRHFGDTGIVPTIGQPQ